MKKEKNIFCICILIMLCLIMVFVGKVEAKSNDTCNHIYGIESKVNHTYHYKKCMYCQKEIKEEHKFDENGVCYTCKQTHKKYKLLRTNNKYHYYSCKNEKCTKQIRTKHTWENEKYGEIIQNSTCSANGQLKLECTTHGCNKTKKVDIKKKEHNYKIDNNKVNHTYHYKVCSNCGASKAEKHTMQGNICKICEQIHGVGEIKKTDIKNHYYRCLNESCTTEIKKAHKYTIVEKTDHKNHYLKCVDCSSIKTEEHNNKGKGKTCSKCGELHTLTAYKTDHEKHYLKCVQNGCGEKKSAKHTPNKKGKCTVCYETHKNVYTTNHEYHYIKCTNANCTYKTEPEKHTPNKNGVCSKCKETHKLVTSAKSSTDYITHITKCYMKNCTFEPVEEKHIYTTYNSSEKCAKCGRQWGYNIKGLQGKLYDLGYFKGIYSDRKKAADGIVGENTKNALNEFFKLEGINKEVKDGIITPDIFKDIQNATRTKDKLLKEYNDKILTSLKDNNLLINALCKENSTQKQIANILLNSNVDNLDINSIKKRLSSFDISVLMCLYSNNLYSQGSRDKGRKEIEAVFNNPPRTEEETNEVLNNLKNNRVYFDCSSFASTVMSLGYGINCKTGKGSYNTKTFEDKRKSVFSTEQKTNNKITTIGTKNLDKGDLLLSRRLDGTGHIVVCLGGNKAIHTNTEGKPVRYVDLSDAGKKYLTNTGEFKNVYILKH